MIFVKNPAPANERYYVNANSNNAEMCNVLQTAWTPQPKCIKHYLPGLYAKI